MGTRRWLSPRLGYHQHHRPRQLRVPASYLTASPPEPAPTISIVTPSFQQRRFIGATLYSVLSQGYPSLEYMVQDGGSTDGTVSVLEAFGPALTRWVSEPDGGQADAINRGFAHTSGETMCWLNSDDLLLPGSLASVARVFAGRPDVDVVYGDRILIDEADRRIGSWILPEHSDLALTYLDFIPQETVFWRRRIWEAAGAYADPSFGFALDWDLLLRFRAAGAAIVHLPRYLGAFRIHESQKNTTAAEAGQAECTVLRTRVHGRAVPTDEIRRRVAPYLTRHVLEHLRRGARDRVSRTVEVETCPPERWLASLRDPHAPISAGAQRTP